ncbi:hypothetical protein CDD82_6261 [Ophiocordyceps australis]|uniref:N-acetylglucosamine-induced protein 1 n=1 Tax=Ophiocordyceps australis TaxID=1399860 RepID=A0A2C5Y3A0_9HYPO|nr:hypothetical protein CDD82_6261 [Ophiocordyceps australis]
MGDQVSQGQAAPEQPPFSLTSVDKWVLSQTDDEYQKHDWAELKTIISANDLSVLKRKPSDLRRYMKWTADTKAEYGTMTAYIVANLLPKSWGQPPFTPESDIPFANASDYKILLNDWPYGMEPDIKHLVVWTRTLIPTDPATGDMTLQSRAVVADFVKRKFADTLGPGGEDQVLWFKNWVALQSVRTLEHIHVLVRRVDDEMIQGWTGMRPEHMAAE